MSDENQRADQSSHAAGLIIKGVRKRFGGVAALQQVSMTVRPALVHALVGENGAGKSTLMKIIAGVQPPDEGEIWFEGKRCQFAGVGDAIEAGIAIIHQELNFADNLDVAANIFLGREPTRLGMIDRKKIYRDAADQLRRVGLDVDPRTDLSSLTIGQKQLVEIAKALSIGAKVLIMDEPTSSLTLFETETLLQTIENLRQSGVAVIYISHRLAEIEAIADEVTVLRDGEVVGHIDKNEIERDRMVRMMVGRDISEVFPKERHDVGDVRLRVSEIQTPTYPDHRVSFVVRSGECVGIAGLVGAGRTELLRCIFGVDDAIGGAVRVDDRGLVGGDIAAAIDAGLALVPEDRKEQGAILSMSVMDNISLPVLKRIGGSAGWLSDRAASSLAKDLIDRLMIKVASPHQEVGDLSGGNQQKVVLAKWLATEPSVLLLDEPTRGVDIGAKQEIYRLIDSLAKMGVAILFVSSDMEEVLGLADRILVMHEGKLTGEFLRDEADETTILTAAVGVADAAA